jgi:predicted DNA repair protein MutK
MPGASLIALLDDIASVLDDVAVLTKVATKKTAGVLGDDLALNAQQVAGIRADRELPVVWAVAKGSLVNKAILVPSALAISAVAPWLVTPLLMVGGGYLCFEGCEKLEHKLMHSKDELQAEKAKHLSAVANPEVDLVALEKEKVKGAVRTDFILSAEIVAIALGTVATAAFMTRVWVLAGLAVLMTAGVYGLVAGIVKLDDVGAWLRRRAGAGAGAAAAIQRALGTGIVRAAPWLMKALSVAGTIAMFLVGGGILSHGTPGMHGLVHHWSESVARVPGMGGPLSAFLPTLVDLLTGVVAGSVILAVVMLVKRLRGSAKAASH